MREYAEPLRLGSGVLAAATRRHRRRRIVWRCAAGALAMASVVAIASVVTTGFAVPSRDTPPPQAEGTSVEPSASATRGRARPDALDRTRTALDAGTNTIRHVRRIQVPDNLLRGDTWSDPSTQRTRIFTYHANGTVKLAYTEAISDGLLHQTSVNYDTRTYRTETRPPSGTIRPAGRPSPPLRSANG